MADPDAESDDDFVDNPDYYSVLNVRKDVGEEEIKAAYRRMCVMYHPDKHPNPKDKLVAERIFSKVHKAHEVLSKPYTRMIYDIYGQKGLDAGWEVIERKRTANEIREEYERLQREAEQRRIEQKTNPKGSVTLRIDASDIFTSAEQNDDPFYQDESRSLPSVEIRGISINQSIEAPLTTDSTAVLSGVVQHQNGNGTGNVNVNIRKIFSTKSWGEMEVGIGDGPVIRCKGFRNLGKKTFSTISLNSSLKQNRLMAGLQAMVGRQISKQTMGYLSWTGGSMSAMATTIVRNTEKYHFLAQLQFGIPHSFAAVSYTHKFGSDNKAKIALRFGMLGFSFDYGCENKITSLTRLGATMSIGQATGVTLKIKLHRHTQTFHFPILLCEDLLPSAVFYGTFIPVITYVTMKALLLAPMIRKQKDKQAEETRKKYADLVYKKRKEAQSAINLMLTSYKRIVEQEEQKHGLLITEAWYGRLYNNHNERLNDITSEYVSDVTIPLQCLVKDSKLIITDATKAQLSGFYDPCINEEKHLKIVYEFRDAVHEHIFSDDEAVRIPVRSHKISTKVT